MLAYMHAKDVDSVMIMSDSHFIFNVIMSVYSINFKVRGLMKTLLTIKTVAAFLVIGLTSSAAVKGIEIPAVSDKKKRRHLAN